MNASWFWMSQALGSVLRGARYSSVVHAERHVRKRRAFHAPLLIWLGTGLMRVLNTGVILLPRREWVERERQLYRQLYGEDVSAERGTLVLPRFSGRTLATLLEDPALPSSVRDEAIGLAARSLAAFHAAGLSHGDAMAENVLVDLEGGTARWFDFETMHEPRREVGWCRADDLRALLATALLRTRPAGRAETLSRILDSYGDRTVTGRLAGHFAVMQRALSFHLGQAPLSRAEFQEIRRLLA